MNKKLLTLILACSVLCALAIPIRARAQATSASSVGYQWLITISATSQPTLFNFPGSSLAPAFEADVSMQNSSAGSGSIYEKFWGAAGNALGLERSTTYNIPAGNTIAFKIVHDSTPPTHAENQLAVSALLRVLLDAQLNTNPVLYVVAPSDSYADVIGCFQEQNFQNTAVAPETVMAGAIPLLVVDDTGLLKTNLYYPL